MSSSALRIIAILLAIGAIVLGYMGYQASQEPIVNSEPVVEAPAPEPVRSPILVAARDIKTGQPLDEEDVTTIFVEQIPDDSYSVKQAVLGQQTRVAIAAGDLILKDHFHDFSNLVSSIRPGERAIAVRVDEVTGVGGFVQPGDFVDVFLFLAAGQETGDDSSAQRILSAARVLAYGNTVDTTDAGAIAEKARVNGDNKTDADTAENGETSAESEADKPEPTGKQSKTAVLAVKDKDLSALLLAESTGRLRLALLGPEALAVKTEADEASSKAERQAAEKQQRQMVTLDAFKVEPAKTAPATQPVARQRNTAPPPPPQPKVTVHRGTSEDAVTVDREN